MADEELSKIQADLKNLFSDFGDLKRRKDPTPPPEPVVPQGQPDFDDFSTLEIEAMRLALEQQEQDMVDQAFELNILSLESGLDTLNRDFQNFESIIVTDPVDTYTVQPHTVLTAPEPGHLQPPMSPRSGSVSVAAPLVFSTSSFNTNTIEVPTPDPGWDDPQNKPQVQAQKKPSSLSVANHTVVPTATPAVALPPAQQAVFISQPRSQAATISPIQLMQQAMAQKVAAVTPQVNPSGTPSPTATPSPVLVQPQPVQAQLVQLQPIQAPPVVSITPPPTASTPTSEAASSGAPPMRRHAGSVSAGIPPVPAPVAPKEIHSVEQVQNRLPLLAY